MCTQRKDEYSCGHGTRHPRSDCYRKRPGHGCPKYLDIIKHSHNYPCDICDRIRRLEEEETALRDEMMRLRMWSGPMNERYRENERESGELKSQIADLKRRLQFAGEGY
jgi:hypothetical protein